MSTDSSPSSETAKRSPRRLRRTAITVGAIAVLGLTGAAIAGATIPDSSGVIHGCYNNTSGAVKVIDTAKVSKCPTGTTSLNWNQTGPQGPAGAQGPTGPQGPAGTANVYENQNTVTVPANYYYEIVANCNSTSDKVLGGGVSNSLYFGSSGQLLESYPGSFGGLPAWVGFVANNYSQPETFTGYVICESGANTAATAATAKSATVGKASGFSVPGVPIKH